MSHEAELTFRDHTPEDINFIMDSWGSSYYQGSTALQTFSPAKFHSFHRPVRERLLENKSSLIKICCSVDDPWLIVGWTLFEKSPGYFILHYLYVKNLFQQQGVGQSILSHILPEDVPIITTHMTYNSSRIMGKNHSFFKRFKYVPHAV